MDADDLYALLLQQLHSEVHADARLYHTLREEAAMLDHVQELLGIKTATMPFIQLMYSFLSQFCTLFSYYRGIQIGTSAWRSPGLPDVDLTGRWTIRCALYSGQRLSRRRGRHGQQSPQEQRGVEPRGSRQCLQLGEAAAHSGR